MEQKVIPQKSPIQGAQLQKPWNIPNEYTKLFKKRDLEQLLDSINPIGGGYFYVFDYYREQVITDASSSLTLSGYPKEFVERLAFDFYRHTLSKEEMNWLTKLNIEGSKILYSYPKNERSRLLFYYELNMQTARKTEVVLQHKLVPYQFDKNGNLWLGLCFVSLSLIQKAPRSAYIVNTKTGEQYNFIDGLFQMSKTEAITHEDRKILEWMVNDYTTEQMCDFLKVSDSSFKRKKRNLFEKLSVSTSAGAVHKAHLMGLL